MVQCIDEPIQMTLAATSFSMYGCFWLAYGFMNVSNLGVSETYTGDTEGQLNEALGLYVVVHLIKRFGIRLTLDIWSRFLAVWFIVSFLLT